VFQEFSLKPIHIPRNAELFPQLHCAGYGLESANLGSESQFATNRKFMFCELFIEIGFHSSQYRDSSQVMTFWLHAT
jgi:hypothetical protein